MVTTAKRTGKATTSERPLAVLKPFRTVHGSVRKPVRPVEAVCGVSASRLGLLHEIGREPSLGIPALAERLSFHRTTGSQPVEKLAARGWVTKTRSGEDPRRVGLALTAAARSALKSVPGPAEGVLPSAPMSLPDDPPCAMPASLERPIPELKRRDPAAAGRPPGDL